MTRGTENNAHSWRRLFERRVPTTSESWGQSLPQSPLNRHLVSLHALMLHLGAEGDALALGEYHLRVIAAFTRDVPPEAQRSRQGGVMDQVIGPCLELDLTALDCEPELPWLGAVLAYGMAESA